MAVAQNVALDVLEKLEFDLLAHQNKTAPSIYKFAGYENGVTPVGISKTINVSLNRGGQILQFLAGYYTSTSNTDTKSRIAKAAAQVLNIFGSRKVFTTYFGSTIHTAAMVPNIENNGFFPKDPSGALTFIGLMMLDKQGVLNNPSFAAYSNVTPAYIRSTQIPRQADKVWRACYWFNSEKAHIQTNLTKGPSVWATQNIPQEGLNGMAMHLSALSLYSKMYGVSTYSQAYTDAYNLFRRITTLFSNSYDASGNQLTTTAAGQHSGAVMCIPIGNPTHSRGPFPSVGYNAFVGLSYGLQALAERATTSTTFTNMATTISGHPLQVDALKILNYYRDRVVADGELFELGAHRNFPGSAKRFRDLWQADLQSRGINAAFTGSGLFDELVDPYAHPGSGSYAYPLTAIFPTHTLFDKIASAYANKSLPHIDFSKVGYGSTVAQAFCSTSEAASSRVAAGLGFGLVNGLTTIN